jgi:hypothetical protein
MGRCLKHLNMHFDGGKEIEFHASLKMERILPS